MTFLDNYEAKMLEDAEERIRADNAKLEKQREKQLKDAYKTINILKQKEIAFDKLSVAYRELNNQYLKKVENFENHLHERYNRYFNEHFDFFRKQGI